MIGWLLAAAGLFLLPRPAPSSRVARHRVADHGAGEDAAAGGQRPRRIPALAGAATAAAAALLGGPAGLLAAAPAGVVVMLAGNRLVRSQSDPAEHPQPRPVAFLLDLLAAGLASGAPPELAIEAVAAAVGGSQDVALRVAVEPLRLVGRLLRLGSDPVTAWSVLDGYPELQPVAAAGRRCANSGARLAVMLSDTAGDLRARHRDAAVAGAHRLGVWALLPLGCCFLPAFICIGVVPVVLGVAGQVLTHG